MRIIFIGSVEFSRSALEHLVNIGADLVGVCTLEESKFNSDHVDLSHISALHGIPWLYADDINLVESIDWIKRKAPDVIFCFGWSKLLKQRLLEVAPLGVIGFHPAAHLDMIPMSDLVSAMSDAFRAFQLEEVFLPHPADVHTDHRIVYDAVSGCVKWFRFPSVKRVLAYETLSETDFGLGKNQLFRPSVFIDVEPFIGKKLQAMDIYASEIDEFPFPRCHETLRAPACPRGAASGFKAAEAFELLRERT